jgi:hypothetical protein
MKVRVRSSHAVWRARHEGLGLMLGGLMVLSGCADNPVIPDRCNIRLAAISPDPATLTVGQEVTLAAELTASADCLPADAKAGSLRWTSESSGVAAVDPVTGRVTALSAGTTQVSLTTVTTHTLLAVSVVQVAP